MAPLPRDAAGLLTLFTFLPFLKLNLSDQMVSFFYLLFYKNCTWLVKTRTGTRYKKGRVDLYKVFDKFLLYAFGLV